MLPKIYPPPSYRRVLDAFVAWLPTQAVLEDGTADLVEAFLNLVGLNNEQQKANVHEVISLEVANYLSWDLAKNIAEDIVNALVEKGLWST